MNKLLTFFLLDLLAGVVSAQGDVSWKENLQCLITSRLSTDTCKGAAQQYLVQANQFDSLCGTLVSLRTELPSVGCNTADSDLMYSVLCNRTSITC